MNHGIFIWKKINKNGIDERESPLIIRGIHFIRANAFGKCIETQT